MVELGFKPRVAKSRAHFFLLCYAASIIVHQVLYQTLSYTFSYIILISNCKKQSQVNEVIYPRAYDIRTIYSILVLSHISAKIFNNRVVCAPGSLFPLPSTHINRNHVLEMKPGDRSNCTSKRSLIGSTLTRWQEWEPSVTIRGPSVRAVITLNLK